MLKELQVFLSLALMLIRVVFSTAKNGLKILLRAEDTYLPN